MLKYLIATILLFSFFIFEVSAAEINCQPVDITDIEQLEIGVVKERKELPGFCQVRGILEKRIHIESRLPLKNWNGKFLMAGCGGFCGELLPDKAGFSNSINEALKMGYAVIAHDGGHTAPSFDTNWAYKNPEAFEIWAHKILPIVTHSGKAIIQALYETSPSHSYFSGCSNGGRLGLIAAQRYPDLFDGILAGGPILDLSGNAGVHGAWLIQQLHQQDWSPRFMQAKIPLLKSHVLQQCDHLDGLRDKIIADPGQCQVELAPLQCKPGIDNADCLTDIEINLINNLYQGASDNKGTLLYPGIAYGSEHYFSTWIVGKPGQPSWGPLAGQGHLNLVNETVPGQNFDAHNFNFNRDPSILRQKPMSRMMDATDADLSGIQKSGTKLIIWHGWSDPLILPQRTVDYYDEVIQRTGDLEKTKTFARLFMVPGHGHCWRKKAEAPDQFNPIKLLEDWVESDNAPEQFTAYQRGPDDKVIRSRPICAYPAVAKYSETGDTKSASSFTCTQNQPL